MKLPDQIIEVVKNFSSLQGIGEKTAMRYALSLLRWEREKLEIFADSINTMKEIENCRVCGFVSKASHCELCKYSEENSSEILCLVEGLSDFLAISKNKTFRSHYHILNGVLNPLLGIGPNELGLNQLVERIKAGGYSEVILALSSSVEGDATCSFLRDIIPGGVIVERIGFGLPMGGSLEYVDGLTISKALENRKQI